MIKSQTLDTLPDNRDALQTLVQECRRDLAIYSPDLTPGLYDSPGLERALLALARRHRQTRVRLLVDQTQDLVERSHSLVRLAQRLPSKIALRRTTEELETSAPAFALGDRHLLFYQSDLETFQGVLDLEAGPRVNQLRDAFDRAWNSAEEDPRLRQLAL